MSIEKNSKVKFIYVPTSIDLSGASFENNAIYFIPKINKIYFNGVYYGLENSDITNFLNSMGISKDDTGITLGDAVTITGNLVVTGDTTIIEAETLKVGDNMIELNSTLGNDTPSPSLSGIKVNRGNSGSPYAFIFTNTGSDPLFRIGKLVDETKGPSEGGNDLQAVLTRDDSPTNKGLFYWDSSSKKATTNAKILVDTTGETIEINGHKVIVDGDSRLTDSRTPKSHTHGSITNAGAIGTTKDLVVITGDSGVLTTLAKGTSGQFLAHDGSWATPQNDQYTLGAATDNDLGGIKTGFTPTQQEDRKYPVELDTNNKAFVSVPWTDENTTYGYGDGIKIENNTIKHTNSVTPVSSDTSVQTPTFGGTFNIPSVQYDGQGHITKINSSSVTVPGLPTASSDNSGIVKLGASKNTSTSVTAASTTINRYYPIETDKNDKLMVNVPWEALLWDVYEEED